MKEQSYKVKEIFGPTIQGEGSYAGAVVRFLRLSGCNRWSGRPEDKAKSQCPFCDTDFLGGDMMTSKEIVSALADLHPNTTWQNVVISGGEPALQISEELLQTLSENGYKIHVETNGSVRIPATHHVHHLTMSPKQPLQDTKLPWCHDLKLLWPPQHPEITPESFSRFDFRKAAYLQPVMDENYKHNLASAIEKLYTLPGWKLSLQLHKILEVR